MKSKQLAVVLAVWEEEDYVQFAVVPLTDEAARTWHKRMRESRAREQADKEFRGTLWETPLTFYGPKVGDYDYWDIMEDQNHPDYEWALIVDGARGTGTGWIVHPDYVRTTNKAGREKFTATVRGDGVTFSTFWSERELITGQMTLVDILYARLYFAEPSEQAELLKELAHIHPLSVLDLVENGFQIPGVPDGNRRIESLPQDVLTELLKSKDREVRERAILLAGRVAVTSASQQSNETHERAGMDRL